MKHLKDYSIAEIERLNAGPKMDALVAEVLGYDVLGIVPCRPDPECSGYFLSYNRPNGPWQIDGAPLRPVYLSHCACEFTEPGDQDYFGHNAGCLGIVNEYSLDDSCAFEIVDWLVEQSYSVLVETRHSNISYCQICKMKDKEHLAGFEECIGWGEGRKRPLAICRALLTFVWCTI